MFEIISIVLNGSALCLVAAHVAALMMNHGAAGRRGANAFHVWSVMQLVAMAVLLRVALTKG